MLWLPLYEQFLFPVYTSSHDSNFWKNSDLIQESQFSQKTTNKLPSKPSRVNFWSKLNKKNTSYTKLLNFNYVSRTLGRVNTKNLFAQTVWKFSVCTLHFQWWFQYLKKLLISFKKLTSAKKLPISDDESVLESVFDVNGTCKIRLTQNR